MKIMQATKEIETVLNTYRSKFAIEPGKLTPAKSEIIKRSIFSEFSELSTILFMICERVNSLQSILEKIHQEKVGEEERKRDINRDFQITNELVILIKTTYEWLYHIKELTESDTTIDLLISSDLKEKLQFYCDFRNKLIVHKQHMEVIPMHGIQYSGGNNGIDNVKIFVIPPVPVEAAIKEMDKLFPKCIKDLSPYQAGEGNFYSRWEILSRNYYKLKDQRRGEIINFMQKYGSNSHNIIELVEYIRDFVKKLIPKLSLS